MSGEGFVRKPISSDNCCAGVHEVSRTFRVYRGCRVEYAFESLMDLRIKNLLTDLSGPSRLTLAKVTLLYRKFNAKLSLGEGLGMKATLFPEGLRAQGFGFRVNKSCLNPAWPFIEVGERL